jgi:acetoacetyl-CoA synthetase
MADYMRWLAKERGLALNSDEELWRWSVDNIEAFWLSIWDYFDILHDGEADMVVSGNHLSEMRWFPDCRLNYAEHALRHEADADAGEVAIHHSSEIRAHADVTWHELGAQVRSVATGLRTLGVLPGDRVVSYMPNVVETAIAMLATAAIGAVWSSAAPEFGSDMVIARFKQIEPKVVLACDGYSFGGKLFDRRDEISRILEELPSVEHLIWVPYLEEAAPPATIPVVHWNDIVATKPPSQADFKYQRVPCDHPLWVLYSSGTTGLPKAITHSHVGMVLDQLKSLRLHFNLDRDQSMFFYSTTGWMMWNSVMGALLAGATAILYDGSPSWPTLDRLWDITAKSRATMSGASPTLVAMMEANGIAPSRDHDLSKLRSIVLGGAPSSPPVFDWLYANVKSDLWVINTSGGTDLCGGLVGPMPSRPVRASEIQGRMLGMAVEAWNDDGEAMINEVGELVVTRAFPSMPLFFWGDTDGARMRDAYFNDIPGVWRHGDYIKINERGGCYIYGRSDATLNRHGVRIGTSEIYSILLGIPEIQDSLVVSCETPDGGYLMPLFIELKDEASFEIVEARAKAILRTEGSPRHVPDIIVCAPGIPYTASGKKMEVPVRKLIMGADQAAVISRDGMSNPNVVDWYEGFASRPEIRSLFATASQIA